MSLLSGLLNNATEINTQDVEQELSALMIDGERLEKAFRLIRDLFIFTDKRLILIDKQGMTGKKTEYFSLPYKHISHFSIESAGHFDLDSHLKIWLIGHPDPFIYEFNRGSNLLSVQKALATYVLTP